ncbi:MAG TPA: TIGR04282 family arsenosugar biosynthesis glycosyltransferase [Saprospiraceae bacterium]|nr:TIGR04282 family arsenosugar biosynthesis glycosyltransferase [Saprospiraceae bacterium]HNG90114.1 TIGR04282 family arsenosugar biosynthesis glycosyltransferase [Saprospiraceae bacterium]
MDVLLIFLRNPVLGQVKTRLARSLGDAEALRIYRLLLDKTRHAALDVAAHRWLCYTDFPDLADEWPNAFFEKKSQSPGDLGERMAAAFRQAFEAGARRAVIIGSDCPQLDGPALQVAFEMLDTADIVLGPASDGGYYLLGMKHLAPALFQGIAWSTGSVLQQTLAASRAAGLSVTLLPMLRDVDTLEDWQAYQATQRR